jgi:hypothetical protein
MNSVKKRKENKEMKVKLILAILVATLLLASNMAFAGCSGEALSYDICMTKASGEVDCTECFDVCVNDGVNGTLYDGDQNYTLYEYYKGPPEQSGLGGDNGLSLLINNTAVRNKAFIAIYEGTAPTEVLYFHTDRNRQNLTGIGFDDEGKVAIEGWLRKTTCTFNP